MPRSSVGENTGDDPYRRFRLPEPCWLVDALAALTEIDDEIAEENLPEVSGATKAEAERIVRALARRAPAPTIYPTQDAEIALHFKSPGQPGAVVILLSGDGRADCHAVRRWKEPARPLRHFLGSAGRIRSGSIALSGT